MMKDWIIIRHDSVNVEPHEKEKVENLIKYCRMCVCNFSGKCSAKDKCPVFNITKTVPVPYAPHPFHGR